MTVVWTMLLFKLFLFINGYLLVSVNAASCPCETKNLCEPIKNTTRKEIFIFSLNDEKYIWSNYDYNKTTTIVMVGYQSPELMCYAHKHGVRVVAIGTFPVKSLLDAGARSKWVQTMLDLVKNNFLDGINIDFEDPIPKSQRDVIRAYTSLVAETNEKFKVALPFSQVTVDVAWRQPCVDLRCYDYKALSMVSDFLFVMAYDERSQIHGDCIAGANSAITNAAIGITTYLNLNISVDKLVLGVPWYGYNYQCLHFNKQTNRCSIAKKPFRGVMCSDAAGQQFDYKKIAKLVKSKRVKIMFDNSTMTPFFNYDTTDNQVNQVWFDGPQSLELKYMLAVKKGLRGVGMWNADSIDYGNSVSARLQRKEMWGALPKY